MAGIKITDLEVTDQIEPAQVDKTHLIVVKNGITKRLTYKAVVDSAYAGAAAMVSGDWETRFQQVEADCNNIITKYEGAFANLGQLSTSISAICSAAISSMTETMDHFSEISSSFEGIRDEIESISGAIEEIRDSEDGGIIERVKKIIEVSEAIPNILSSIEHYNGQISNLNNRISEATENTNDLRTIVDGLNTEVIELSNSVNYVKDAIVNDGFDDVKELVNQKLDTQLAQLDLEEKITNELNLYKEQVEQIKTEEIAEAVNEKLEDHLVNFTEQVYNWISEESSDVLKFCPIDGDPRAQDNGENSQYLELYRLWTALTADPDAFGAENEEEYEENGGDEETSDSSNEDEGDDGDEGGDGVDNSSVPVAVDSSDNDMPEDENGYRTELISQNNPSGITNGIVFSPKFLYRSNWSDASYNQNYEARFKTTCPSKMFVYINKNRILKNNNTTTTITIINDNGMDVFKYKFRNVSSETIASDDICEGDFNLAFAGEVPENYIVRIEMDKGEDTTITTPETAFDLDSSFLRILTYASAGVNTFNLYIIKGNLLTWSDVFNGNTNLRYRDDTGDEEYAISDYNTEEHGSHVDLQTKKTANNDFDFNDDYVSKVVESLNNGELIYKVDTYADPTDPEGSEESIYPVETDDGANTKTAYIKVYPFQKIVNANVKWESALDNGLVELKVCSLNPVFSEYAVTLQKDSSLSAFDENLGTVQTTSIESILRSLKTNIIDGIDSDNPLFERIVEVRQVDTLPSGDPETADSEISTILYKKDNEYYIWDENLTSAENWFKKFFDIDGMMSDSSKNIQIMVNNEDSTTQDIVVGFTDED